MLCSLGGGWLSVTSAITIHLSGPQGERTGCVTVHEAGLTSVSTEQGRQAENTQ